MQLKDIRKKKLYFEKESKYLVDLNAINPINEAHDPINLSQYPDPKSLDKEGMAKMYRMIYGAISDLVCSNYPTAELGLVEKYLPEFWQTKKVFRMMKFYKSDIESRGGAKNFTIEEAQNFLREKIIKTNTGFCSTTKSKAGLNFVKNSLNSSKDGKFEVVVTYNGTGVMVHECNRWLYENGYITVGQFKDVEHFKKEDELACYLIDGFKFFELQGLPISKCPERFNMYESDYMNLKVTETNNVNLAIVDIMQAYLGNDYKQTSNTVSFTTPKMEVTNGADKTLFTYNFTVTYITDKNYVAFRFNTYSSLSKYEDGVEEALSKFGFTAKDVPIVRVDTIKDMSSSEMQDILAFKMLTKALEVCSSHSLYSDIEKKVLEKNTEDNMEASTLGEVESKLISSPLMGLVPFLKNALPKNIGIIYKAKLGNIYMDMVSSNGFPISLKHSIRKTGRLASVTNCVDDSFGYNSNWSSISKALDDLNHQLKLMQPQVPEGLFAKDSNLKEYANALGEYMQKARTLLDTYSIKLNSVIHKDTFNIDVEELLDENNNPKEPVIKVSVRSKEACTIDLDMGEFSGIYGINANSVKSFNDKASAIKILSEMESKSYNHKVPVIKSVLDKNFTKLTNTSMEFIVNDKDQGVFTLIEEGLEGTYKVTKTSPSTAIKTLTQLYDNFDYASVWWFTQLNCSDFTYNDSDKSSVANDPKEGKSYVIMFINKDKRVVKVMDYGDAPIYYKLVDVDSYDALYKTYKVATDSFSKPLPNSSANKFRKFLKAYSKATSYDENTVVNHVDPSSQLFQVSCDAMGNIVLDETFYNLVSSLVTSMNLNVKKGDEITHFRFIGKDNMSMLLIPDMKKVFIDYDSGISREFVLKPEIKNLESFYNSCTEILKMFKVPDGVQTTDGTNNTTTEPDGGGDIDQVKDTSIEDPTILADDSIHRTTRNDWQEQLIRLKDYVLPIVKNLEQDFGYFFIDSEALMKEHGIKTPGFAIAYYGNELDKKVLNKAEGVKKLIASKSIKRLKDWSSSKDPKGQDCLIVIFMDVIKYKELKAQGVYKDVKAKLVPHKKDTTSPTTKEAPKDVDSKPTTQEAPKDVDNKPIAPQPNINPRISTCLQIFNSVKDKVQGTEVSYNSDVAVISIDNGNYRLMAGYRNTTGKFTYKVRAIDDTKDSSQLSYMNSKYSKEATYSSKYNFDQWLGTIASTISVNFNKFTNEVLVGDIKESQILEIFRRYFKDKLDAWGTTTVTDDGKTVFTYKNGAYTFTVSFTYKTKEIDLVLTCSDGSNKVNLDDYTMNFKYNVDTHGNIDTFAGIFANTISIKCSELANAIGTSEPVVQDTSHVTAPKAEFKFKPQSDADFQAQLQRLLDFLKPHKPKFDANPDISYFFIDTRAEMTKHKVKTPCFAIAYYGDETDKKKLNKIPEVMKLIASKSIKRLKDWTYTTDTDGNECAVVLFMDVVKYKELKAQGIYKDVKTKAFKKEAFEYDGERYVIKSFNESTVTLLQGSSEFIIAYEELIEL